MICVSLSLQVCAKEYKQTRTHTQHGIFKFTNISLANDRKFNNL